jgi:UPF0271 protein
VRIDLNADLGELGIEHDAPLLASITSASLAAGFHAGTPSSLRADIRLATVRGVAVGAHPSFDDRGGLGRREIEIAPQEAEDLVLYQIAAVAGMAVAEGITLRHVKPHGALYNMAARDAGLAAAVVRAITAFDRSLALFAPPSSALAAAGRGAGLRVAAEAFADRAYRPDGQLADRSLPGAIIRNPDLVVSRALRIVTERRIAAVDGSDISIEADTICVHGDTPGAADLAARLRAALVAAGIEVRPFGT